MGGSRRCCSWMICCVSCSVGLLAWWSGVSEKQRPPPLAATMAVAAAPVFLLAETWANWNFCTAQYLSVKFVRGDLDNSRLSRCTPDRESV